MSEPSPQNHGDYGDGPEAREPGKELVPAWLVELLVCPSDGGLVRIAGDSLVCESCGRLFPVREGIPVMILDDAEIEQPF